MNGALHCSLWTELNSGRKGAFWSLQFYSTWASFNSPSFSLLILIIGLSTVLEPLLEEPRYLQEIPESTWEKRVAYLRVPLQNGIRNTRSNNNTGSTEGNHHLEIHIGEYLSHKVPGDRETFMVGSIAVSKTMPYARHAVRSGLRNRGGLGGLQRVGFLPPIRDIPLFPAICLTLHLWLTANTIFA